MKELFDLSTAPENLFPTILLIFVAVYWVIFLIGLLDFSFLDFDLDKDIDLTTEVDLDMDVEVDGSGHLGNDAAGHGNNVSAPSKEIGLGTKILSFLNLGDVPFMAFMTFFALFFWAGCILGHHYLSKRDFLLSVLITLGSIVVAALLTKVFTQPFRKFFKSLNQAEKPLNLTGQLCIMETGTEGERLGQADVTLENKHLLVNVKSDNGQRIDKGIQCVLLSKDESGDFYYIQPFDLE